MTGKRQRSCYRKTRKRKGLGGALKSSQSSKETPSKETEIESRPGTSHDLSDQSDSGEESDQPLSSSRKKMKLQSSEDESSDFCQETEEVHEGNGYRLIELEGLSSVLSNVHKCKKVTCQLEASILCLVFSFLLSFLTHMYCYACKYFLAEGLKILSGKYIV